MAYDYKKLSRQNKDNSPGVTTRAWMAPKRTFTSIAKPVDPPVNPGDKIRISDDHEFDVADGFIQIYATQDTASISSEITGEMDSRGLSKTAEFFYPGLGAEALEFADEAKNDEWIILFENLDGTILQIGSEMLPAEITHALATGTLSSDKKGITFTVNNFGKLYVYEGVVTEKPIV
ncbi:hypothetical protein [Marivirga sp.]|uniref:hypothetical protein n=1 Tax=Marivirga sp. TaxID=2018662 RepID=UPI003DA70641